MIKKYIRNVVTPIVIFVLNYLVLFGYMYVMAPTRFSYEFICLLAAILLAIVDYIIMRYIYKDAHVIWKIIGIIIVLIIDYYSVVAADKLIAGDDFFAFLEGGKMILNSQALLFIAIAIEFFWKRIRKSHKKC